MALKIRFESQIFDKLSPIVLGEKITDFKSTLFMHDPCSFPFTSKPQNCFFLDENCNRCMHPFSQRQDHNSTNYWEKNLYILLLMLKNKDMTYGRNFFIEILRDFLLAVDYLLVEGHDHIKHAFLCSKKVLLQCEK